MQCAGIGSVEVMASTRNLSHTTSGGGFSSVQPRPAYQTVAVDEYLSSGAILPGPLYFNSTGRAYPDVSAINHNIFLWKDRAILGGTDGASTSIFAAILALANAVLYDSGLPPVGFVNPAIYWIANSTPSAFEDIDCEGCVNNCNQAPTGW